MKKVMGAVVFALVDIVCFLQGGIITAYALLHFSYKVEIVRSETYLNEGIQSLPNAIGGYYYYSDAYIKIVIIGVALIITGFLMRSWRKTI